MARRLFGTDVTISFEPVEDGWTQARITALPSVITAAATREETRDAAIDALMEVLAVEPTPEKGAEHERVHLDVLTGRVLECDLGHGR